MNLKSTCCIALLVYMLTGCGLVHKMTIDQGNYISEEQVEQLKIGMSKQQIRYVLGTPMLFDESRPNTWQYVFYIKKGYQPPDEKKIIIQFDSNGKAMSIQK